MLIEATLQDIKGGFESVDYPLGVHPNAVCGTLDAIEAQFGIPVLYTSADLLLAYTDKSPDRLRGGRYQTLRPYENRAAVRLAAKDATTAPA